MISVVVPTLDEELALPATLESILTAAAFGGDEKASETGVGGGPVEVLVVDGGSTDGTRQVVEAFATRSDSIRFLTARRGRGAQMNAGAAAAGGEWLLFLHADTRLPRTALRTIATLPGRVEAGGFRQRFAGSSRLLALLSRLHNLRFRATRVIYGDQAMFVRRRRFLALGGFPERPMEDISFSLALRRATRPVLLAETVLTDPRKFDRLGHWRALARAISLLVRHRLGRDVSGDAFFDPYR